MITFDRMKLVTSANHITNFNPSQFLKIPYRYGYYYKYVQEHPYMINIIYNEKSREFVLDFTGKVLKDDYTRLINKETIRQCLQNIQDLNLFEFDVDTLIQEAEVCRCDVTMDVKCPFPIDTLKRHIKASIKNYDKWLCRSCENNGVEIYNNATTSKRQKRFIIYDKNKELNMARNRDFLNGLDDKDDLLQYFANKLRFEFNLRTKEQVRSFLRIPDNKLCCVLNSTANPILEIFDLAIDEVVVTDAATNNKADKLALLQQCSYNLQAVEMRIRESSPKTSSIRRKMEPYRKLLQEIQGGGETMKIRDLLEQECINPPDVSK